MSFDPSRYRSKRLRNGKPRYVTAEQATPHMAEPKAGDMQGGMCRYCETILQGTQAQIREHYRTVHPDEPRRNMVEPR